MAINQLIAEVAKKGAAIKNLGPMCGTCAFKLNSPANLEPHNVDRAVDCLTFGGQFNCHKNEYENAGVICKGFQYAKQYFESIEQRDKLELESE